MFFKLFILINLTITTFFADVLDDIEATNEIRVGVKYDFKPFGFINNYGEIAGFDVDLSKYISKKMGFELQLVQVTSKTRIQMLLDKKVDFLAASMTNTKKRDELVDFSISYFFDGQALLVLNKERRTSYKDFVNSKIAAVKGATSGANFKKLQKESKIIYFSEYPQAIRALRKGHVSALTTDFVWCELQASNSKGVFKVLKEKLSFEPYGIAFLENNKRLEDLINSAILDSVKDGTYNRLYKKWFKKEPTIFPKELEN